MAQAHADTAIDAPEAALMRMLLNKAPIGFAFFDRDFRYALVNAPLARINGRSIEEHIGKHVSEVVPDMSRETVSLFEQILETGQPILGVELRGATGSQPGEVRDWLVNYYPVE